jgi:hypothetical protein
VLVTYFRGIITPLAEVVQKKLVGPRTHYRVRSLMQALAIRWIDPLFAHRHPGPLMRRVVRTFAPLIRKLQPNDKWNLEAFLEDWSKILDVPPVLPLPKSKRIFIFSCYRGQFTRDLIMAMLLAWRGHRVTVGYLPKLQSPIKHPLNDAKGVGEYLKAVLGRVGALTGGRVICHDLSATPIETESLDEAYLVSQSRADTVMAVRRERLDPRDPEVERASAYYRALGERTYRLALSYFRSKRNCFDLIVLANGAAFENGYFCRAAKDLGLPVNTHEKFAFSEVVVMTHGDAFFQFSDLDLVWKRRRELGLFDESMRGLIREKAWNLLRQRRTSTGRAWGWQYQKGRPSQRAEELLGRLGIEANGFALVCPNVPFDAGYESWLTLFPSMRQWLTETVTYLLQDPALPIVVRAHPAETRIGYGREKIANILAEAGLSDPRIVVVPGDGDVNTYDLMELCRFACVFASTTGVEIAMHGKPVIAGANVYYARCGITVPAANRDDYFVALSGLIERTSRDCLRTADDAATVYFLFHYLLQWRFPYDKPSQISAMPLRLLAENPEIANIVETLDVLAMTREEFGTALLTLVCETSFVRRWGWLPSNTGSPAVHASLSAEVTVRIAT